MFDLGEIERLGFHIRWKTVLVGWEGPGTRARQIDGGQVIDFAARKLAGPPGEEEAMIIDLASMASSNTEGIDSLLRILARNENSHFGMEMRKWRLLLLTKVLSGLTLEPLYAWIALAEFWLSFENPDDAPVIIREFDSVLPVDRYTKRMRQRLLSDHYKWVGEELWRLSESD